MSGLAAWQQRFIDAMQRPGEADADLGQHSGLDVYRNNIRSSLIEALGEAYPHTRQLLGERFFDSTANTHVRESPPTDPRLNRYGSDLAERLDSLPSLENYRFVSDICRLECGRLQVSHAAEAPALNPEQLAELDLESLLVAPLPASRHVHCRHDVEALWHSLEQGLPTANLGDRGPGDWLILRHQRRVRLIRMDSTTARLYQAIRPDQPLGDIFEALVAELGSADTLGAALGNLLALGALSIASDTSAPDASTDS